MIVSKDFWSKRPHFSIEGIEVVPANGLEVAFDNSPEVVTNQWNEKRKKVTFWRYRRINWRRALGGKPLLWIAIGIITFVVGIATGGIVVSAIASKAKLSQAGSSQAPLVPHSTTSPSRSTFSDPFFVTPSASMNAAQTSLPSLSSIDIGGSEKLNYQTFTGALGGIAPSPVTSSGEPTMPFAVDGRTFSDLSMALQQSCNDQQDNCALSVNRKGTTFLLSDCDAQLGNCTAVSNSAATTSAGTNSAAAQSAGFMTTTVG
ncbi:hypothetical protein N431DRAFT_481578 [Stipitochalara longipes BDJ]|nr:hypothetical protein N431DRAFT_481578 [Stipitochalara longipes BDJ]